MGKKTAKQAAGSTAPAANSKKTAKQAAGSKAPAANPTPKKVKEALKGARPIKPLTDAQRLVPKITRGEDGKFTAEGNENQMAVATALLDHFAAAFDDPPGAAVNFGLTWLEEGLKESLTLQLDDLQLDAVQSKDVITAFMEKFKGFRKSDLRKVKKDTHDAEQASLPAEQRQTFRASEKETFETKHGKTQGERKKEIAASLGKTTTERANENCQAKHGMSRNERDEQNCQAAHEMSRSELGRTAATRKFFALAREMAALPPLAPRSALRAAPASSAATKYCPKPVSRRRAAKRDSHYADLRTKLGPPPTRVRFLY
jgi:hypothetical protein